MEPEKLYKELAEYFPNTLDLMRHLDVRACWEYFIFENSIEEGKQKLHYFLFKDSEDSLKMTKDDPGIEPDLILYFTERAILDLIKGSPEADEYYSRYKYLMENPKPGIQIDNKIDKARLKLWKLGYKKWQSDFNF
ncbi:MAG: hypothetical protein GF311_12295 [Candidatus Lokiarchaeota archaeon]|nr:hypothetical protein [Candidatus Lokiarchaeota archaeon]